VTKELEKQLVDAYPALFVEYGGNPRETCMAWGCTHGDGWFNILKSLCAQINHYVAQHPGMEVRFLQVKEKFGSLRVYHNGDENVRKIVDQHEELSERTCEQCGQPGEVIKTGWMACLCPECLEKKLAAKS